MGDESLKYAFRPLLPDIHHIQFNNIEDIDQITDQTACVVVETIQAEAGIIPPEEGFLQALRSKCDETGTLLIIDDIQMGIGRTGKLFSFENYGIQPDILVLAKALGGGMPLGAFIASKEIMHTLTYGPELGHITTFGGHPVSCAAALAGFEVIVENVLHDEADRKGLVFKHALTANKHIKAIRQKGLMLGLDTESAQVAVNLVSVFLDHGLITDRFLFRPHAFRIAPPLTITDHEIEKTISKIKKALAKL